MVDVPSYAYSRLQTRPQRLSGDEMAAFFPWIRRTSCVTKFEGVHFVVVFNLTKIRAG